MINPTGFSLTWLAFAWHYFKKAWWSGEKAPHVFFRSDWDEVFRDQDRLGHLLGGYQLMALAAAGFSCADMIATTTQQARGKLFRSIDIDSETPPGGSLGAVSRYG